MEQAVSQLKGVGPKRAQQLEKLGILTVQDLIRFVPAGYRDMRIKTPVADLQEGQTAAVFARVEHISKVSRIPGRHFSIVRIRITDDSGRIDAVYFNQPYITNVLKEDEWYVFYGKTGRYRSTLVLQNPEFFLPEKAESEAMTPLYHLTQGISQKTMRTLVRAALEAGPMPQETLDTEFCARYDLPGLEDALCSMHFPRNEEDVQKAARRLSFEELLSFQIAMMIRRRERMSMRLEKMLRVDWDAVQQMTDSLPYDLTGAQKRTIQEILEDMSGAVPMNRLVQGDVGSGKTVVAAAAILAAARAGRQSIMMAPTEILARQHQKSLESILNPFNIEVGILTGSLTRSERKVALEKIDSGEWQVIVGTHALFSADVIYRDLGLVITDEQHRFGVEQRSAAEQKGETPHTLVMSATPIPRSLALVLYADLDISVIDELPPGRKPVNTRIVQQNKRESMYGYLAQRTRLGEKCYVVCPLVDESEAIEAKSAEEVYDELRSLLPDCRIGLLHGKMPEKEKQAQIQAFADGRIMILVSTTVVEVGMDIPEATVMVVENAERFGLAQLHQLRGRVGRNDKECWCFLVKGGPEREEERLSVMVHSNDGFEIAQRDLMIRGPGQILGTSQSGTINSDVIRLIQDPGMVRETREAALELVQREDAQAQKIIYNALKTIDLKTKRIVMN